ncbi:MAG: leucine-rich repeat protein [Ruminiclostridium sp.]|nr:leucine-rich repeat protein [Ruminiclostridium sp.]
MKKIISGIAVALTMAGAMVMNAGAVNSTLSTSGVKVIDSSDNDGGNTCLKILTETVNGSLSLESTDIIKATIFGDEGVDTSDWQILLNAFDSDWGGWNGVMTEPGILEAETTVQYLMNVISCTDIDSFGGFLFHAVGTEDGANVNYTFSILPGYDGVSGDYSYYENKDGTVNIACYSGNATALEIPSTLNGKEVTGIEELAFSGCTSLKSVVIPDSITIIYDNAFLNCTALETLTIPASITDIFDTAFDGCDSLTTVNYVTNTRGHKFAYDNGLTTESYMVFDEQEDGTLELMAYGGTDASVTIPSQVDGKKVTAINHSTFKGCTFLQSVSIPVGITRIETYAFEGCTSLKSVVIPEGVTEINHYTFQNCSSLEEVTIPASVETIYIDAFFYCDKLDAVYYTPNTRGHAFAFQNGYATTPFILTTELDDGTLELTGYGSRETVVTLPSELDGKKITSISAQALSSCQSATTVIIPDSFTNIGDNAFLCRTRITSITIPKSVTKISTTAFDSCSSELVIHCYKDSTAHIYAASNGISYELIEEEAEITPPSLSVTTSGYKALLQWTEVKKATAYDIYVNEGDGYRLFKHVIPSYRRTSQAYRGFVTTTGNSGGNTVIEGLKTDEDVVYFNNEYVQFGGTSANDVTVKNAEIIAAGTVEFKSPSMVQNTELTIGNNCYVYGQNGFTFPVARIGGNVMALSSGGSVGGGPMYVLGDLYSPRQSIGTVAYVNGDMYYANSNAPTHLIYVNGDLFLEKDCMPNAGKFVVGGNVYCYGDDSTARTYASICEGKVYNLKSGNIVAADGTTEAISGGAFSSVQAETYLKFDLSSEETCNSDEQIRECLDYVETYCGTEGGSWADVWPSSDGTCENIATVKQKIVEKIGNPGYINWDLEDAFYTMGFVNGMPAKVPAVDSSKQLDLVLENDKGTVIKATIANDYYILKSVTGGSSRSSIIFDTFMGDYNEPTQVADKAKYANMYIYLEPNCYVDDDGNLRTDNAKPYDCFSWDPAGNVKFVFIRGMGSVTFVVPDGVKYIQPENGYVGHIAVFEKLTDSTFSVTNNSGVLSYGASPSDRMLPISASTVTALFATNTYGTSSIFSDAVINTYNDESNPARAFYIHNNVFLITMSENADMDFSGGQNVFSGFIYAPYMTFNSEGIYSPANSGMIGGMVVSDFVQSTQNDTYVHTIPYDYYGRYVNTADSPEDQEETRKEFMENLMTDSGCTQILTPYVTPAFEKLMKESGCVYVDSTSLQYLTDTLTANKPYSFYVKAITEDGNTYDSEEKIAVIYEEVTTPATPENLTYVADGNSLTLSWEEVDSADGYTVYLYVFGGWAKLGDVTTCEYTVSGLAPCTEYKFAVAAYNEAAGERATSDKTEITVTPLHDYDDTYTTDKAPTCTEEGIESIHCKNCDAKKDERPIPAKNHSYSETVVAPTYSQQGYTLHECECGDSYKDNFTDKLTLPTVSNVNAEQYGRFVFLSWDNVADADGYTIYLFDGEKYIEYGRAISNYYVFVGLNPCTQYKFAVSCYVTEDGRAVNGEATELTFSTEHEYEEEYTVDKAPTCDEDGTESIHCKHCDAKKDERPITAPGHSYTDTVFEATYFSQGYTRHDCDNCDYYYDDNFTAMLKLTTPEISVSTEKSFVVLDWTAVENADGYIIYLYDGEQYVEYGRTIANSYVFSGLSACTEYKFAVRAYITVDDNTATSDLSEVTVSFGHDYEEDYTVDKAPTCTEDGIESIHCRNCDAKKDERPITAPGHSYTDTVFEATYFSQGYTRHDCDNCDYYYDDNFTAKLAITITSPSRSTTAIRLNWDKIDTATGYIIEQFDGEKWIQIADITDNATITYKVTGLKSGTAYKFRMKAYSVTEGGGIIYSNKTATLTVNTQASSVKDFDLKSRSSVALRLKWSKNTAVDGYVIEQKIDGVWVQIADIDDYATTEYKVTGLTAATSYEFRMKSYAITKYGEKTYSAYTSTLIKTTNPSAVSGLKVKSKSDKAIRLAWTANATASGYLIEQYVDGNWVQIADVNDSATTEYKVTGLASATEYQFRVRTYFVVGETTLYSEYKTVNGTTL